MRSEYPCRVKSNLMTAFNMLSRLTVIAAVCAAFGGLGTAFAQSNPTPTTNAPASTPAAASGVEQPPTDAQPAPVRTNATEASMTGESGAEDKAKPSPPKAQDTASLKARIIEARKRADALLTRATALRQQRRVAPADASEYKSQINSWTTLLSVSNERVVELENLEQQATDEASAEATKRRGSLATEVRAAESALTSIDKRLEAAAAESGWKLVETLLRARCASAICFDNGATKDWLGIEPLVELPFGQSFGLSNSGLNDYVNNHELHVDLAAGVRVWLFRDVISVSMYMSKPLSDSRVRLEGSPFVYPASAIRRPFPGFALGALFDSIWIGFDRDELRNGDGQEGSTLNPDFPPNKVISSTWTLTIALQPVTAFRTAIGTAALKKDEP